MELNNVKLDWAQILEGEIKHMESLYPELPVRVSYKSIIEELNKNAIPSRVILNGINVAAYSFIKESSELNDRLYGSIGFTDIAFATDERISNLLSWLVSISQNRKKRLMLNKIFNDGELSEAVLTRMGFKKFERNRMQLYLDDSFRRIHGNFDEQFIPVPVGRLDMVGYADSEFKSYAGTADEILFNSKDWNQRIEFVKSLFKGKFGEIIADSSIILSFHGQIVGSVITTHQQTFTDVKTALLLDLFVTPEFKGKGLGKMLLVNSLISLRSMGYDQCILWVSETNPARSLYEKIGFRSVSDMKEIFYYI